jgi:hypothetical protein
MPNKSNLKYDQAQMDIAIAAVNEGNSINSTAKLFMVPRMTLSDKLSQRQNTKDIASFGPQGYLINYEVLYNLYCIA